MIVCTGSVTPVTATSRLESLTDRLATPVVPDNNSQGRVELDDLDVLVVKRADTANGELVERSPKWSASCTAGEGQRQLTWLDVTRWVKPSGERWCCIGVAQLILSLDSVLRVRRLSPARPAMIMIVTASKRAGRGNGLIL
jgi:hypothetical protein